MRPRISLGRSVFQNSFNANFAIRPSTCVTSDNSLQNSDKFVTTPGQVSCDKKEESATNMVRSARWPLVLKMISVILN